MLGLFFVVHVMTLWCRNKAEHLKEKKKKISHWKEVKLTTMTNQGFLLGFLLSVCVCLLGLWLINTKCLWLKKIAFSRSTIKNRFNVFVRLNCENVQSPLSTFDQVKLVIMLIITLIFISIWSLCTVDLHIRWNCYSPEIFGPRLVFLHLKAYREPTLRVPRFCSFFLILVIKHSMILSSWLNFLTDV